VGTYPVIFLLRRSFFVAITFAMMFYPSLQVQLMIYSTLGYLCYISLQRFHESPLQRRTEMFNEMLLLCLCYHFVLFADEIWDDGERNFFGQSTIIFVCFLLGVNTLLILAINFKVITLKFKRCVARKKA